MGRPKKKPEDRRREATIRLDPEVRLFFDQAAKASGRSFAKELEARLAATVGLDDVGLDLIKRISQEISSICKLTGGNWHEHLLTWAAVSEMLASGPISEFDPARPEQDGFVRQKFEELDALEGRRLHLIRQLADYGIGIHVRPHLFNPHSLPGAGLAALAGEPYAAARLLCQKLDASGDKEEALSLLSLICELDLSIEDANAALKEALRPYFDETKEGQLLYRTFLRDEAVRNRQRGEPFNIHHLWEDGA